MKTNNSFLNSLNKVSANESVSVTENGAFGHERTEHALTDFFFKVGSMRDWAAEKIQDEFSKVYTEDKQRALELMFFVRDCRGGQGEKRVFSIVFSWLAQKHPEQAIKLLSLIPEYGSWKSFFDLTELIQSKDTPLEFSDAAIKMFINQWDKDIDRMEANTVVSLFTKWCPSINTSSKETVARARYWSGILGLSEKEYRKTLATLRNYLKVIETKMAANKWSEIDYNAVPSRAGVIYRNAFMKHDEERRKAWLESLKKNDGAAKINTDVLDVTTIVNKYHNTPRLSWESLWKNDDVTLEAAWKDLVEKGKLDKTIPNMLPVIDGSGSMYLAYVAHVAMGLGLFLANINKGEWKGKVMSFGTNPRLYEVPTDASLRDQLIIASEYNDCGTTNLEKVFDQVLEAAVKANLKQEEIPQIVIFSDMEFNQAMQIPDKKLFEVIAKKYAKHGYKLPKLFFWNIASRTNTIPMLENELGVGLISGFNQSIMKMFLSGKTDPYNLIVEQLDNKRYDLVREAMA